MENFKYSEHALLRGKYKYNFDTPLTLGIEISSPDWQEKVFSFNLKCNIFKINEDDAKELISLEKSRAKFFVASYKGIWYAFISAKSAMETEYYIKYNKNMNGNYNEKTSIMAAVCMMAILSDTTGVDYYFAAHKSAFYSNFKGHLEGIKDEHVKIYMGPSLGKRVIEKDVTIDNLESFANISSCQMAYYNTSHTNYDNELRN